MSLLKSTIPIKGMHCRSCEILLEDALSGVAHVKKCEVSWQAGTAQVYFSSQRAPFKNDIVKTIRAAGYEWGTAEKTSFFSKNPKDYKDLIMAFLFLAGLYFIFKGLNLPGFNLPNWIFALANFDGLHYIFIARDGYVQYEQAFFPLYPLSIKFLTPLFFNNQLLTGLLISNVSFFLGLFFSYKRNPHVTLAAQHLKNSVERILAEYTC